MRKNEKPPVPCENRGRGLRLSFFGSVFPGIPGSVLGGLVLFKPGEKAFLLGGRGNRAASHAFQLGYVDAAD